MLVNMTTLASAEGTLIGRVRNSGTEVIKLLTQAKRNPDIENGWLQFEGLNGCPLWLAAETWRRIAVLDEGQADIDSKITVAG
jgi:hypothetical protein